MALALDPSVGVEVAADAVDRALLAGADSAKVMHGYQQQFEVNFDTHDVTLVRSTVSDSLSITVFVDGCRGATELTGRGHDAVDRAVKEAVTAARAGQPDFANVLPEDPATEAVSDGDEVPDKEQMIDAVLRFISAVRDEYPSLRTESSAYAFECTWRSYANSYGRVQHARRGRYRVNVMSSGKDGERSTSFNHGAVVSERPTADLATLVPIHRLLEDLAASFDPQPVPATFVGDLIFTPEALSVAAGTIAQAVSGMALIRKGTPFADSLGKAIAAPSFSLLHQPSALAGSTPFDAEGFANGDLDIIRDGVLSNFLIDWYSAHRLDRPMTTGCTNFVVAPGETPLEELIASTDQGILLGRFSGGMPNQKLDFSGVAKSSFYVEGGKVRGPLSETMIAGNFADVLQQIRAVSRETVDFGYFSGPWVAARGVTISTK